MKYTFNFPDLGEGLEEGTVLEWYVKPGDKVKVGNTLVQMETDKVVADIPSPKDGTIVKLYGNVDDVIKVGAPLVEFEIEGTDSEEGDDDGVSVVGTIEVAGKAAVMAASDEGVAEPAHSKDTQTSKALATPVARELAKQLGVDIYKVRGSGPSGRVKKEDIINFSTQYKNTETSTSDVVKVGTMEDISYEPLPQIRKTIAKNMLQSKHNAAHMTVFEEAEISSLIQVKEKYKQRFADKGVKLTYLPFILKAVAQALKYHPQLNSQLDMENNRIMYRNRYHIGIAVDAPDGLVVPVVRDADRLSIFKIAKEISELAEKARTRKLTLDNLKDGSFSITSYGSIGGIYATPVINYPQAGILGIGRILKTPIVKDDDIVVGTVMPLSLSVDHRVADGGETTRFLNRVMEYLTDPVSFLMDDE